MPGIRALPGDAVEMASCWLRKDLEHVGNSTFDSTAHPPRGTGAGEGRYSVPTQPVSLVGADAGG